MKNQAAEQVECRTVRKSFIVTFANHPPIRLWGDFDASEVEKTQSAPHTTGDYLSDYEEGTLWDRNPQWGHNDVCYYICKSGKRLYWGSYNSGMQCGGREPKTVRTFLADIAAIREYIIEHSDVSEWNRVGYRVDPSLIVNSDLL